MTTPKSNPSMPLFTICVDPVECQRLAPEAICDLESECDSKWPDEGGLVDFHFEKGQAWIVNRVIAGLLAGSVGFLYEFWPAKGGA